MRKYERWIVVFVVVFLPGIVLRLVVTHEPDKLLLSSETSVTQIQSNTNGVQQINVLHNGQVLAMRFDDYLCGVLLGEMPASFHEEALKAQAVAARTYTLKMLRNAQKHVNADICTDYTCCQAYIDPEGNDSIQKIRDAVYATAGKVLIFDGDLIEATYFSCSGGRTEAAVEVWGEDIPYLQAIDSPWDADAKYHRDMFVISEKELLEKLDIYNESEEFTYSNVIYTDGGGVDTIEICGKEFSGVQIRSMLGLRSTAFSIEKNDDSICFITKGFGHRVGMSQYGADAMAQQGSQYEEILAFYYPQTQLITLRDDQLCRLFDKAGNL